MKSAIFHNFTTKPFTGYWNGKPKTFKPGDKVWMEEYLARHFAKHLTNHVLLTSGNAKDETYTSPKKPEQVPQFMDIFNKAFIPDESAEEKDEAQVQTDLAQRAHGQTPAPAEKAQIVEPPAGDDEDEEAAFEGAKDAAAKAAA